MVGNLVSVTLKTGSFKNVFVYHPSRVWLMHTLQQIWLSWYKIYTIVSENQSISQTQYSQKDARNKCLPDQTEPNLRKVLQNEIPHPVRISCLQKFKNNVEEYGFYLTKKLQEHCLKWFQIQTKRKKNWQVSLLWVSLLFLTSGVILDHHLLASDIQKSSSIH